ncbi:MAG: hypothetical protein IPJ87_02230 [Flavobacteriales bacterium]|jgi:hypothetical protein|nr:hypothetical protein [Flavobacteriales bacterium]MBK7940690.1 hypothetical protein [Flavobacteriales bacterium]MBK8949500.1 hypothetical protein [Flavobacteriales bacterium]MBK9700893.1 hypothetical protein [Flavobacteriales bacterium]
MNRWSTAIVLSAFGLLSACKDDPTQSEQYKGLSTEKATVDAALAERDSSLNVLFGSFNRISENLRTIREKQGMIGGVKVEGEPSQDMEQRILGDLQQIDELLSENKALIAKLRKETKANAGAIAALQRTVEELERTVAEKDAEIGGLKEQLASANSSLATLMEMYRDKEQQANMQRNELNTAHYVIGTAKELKEKGIVTKEGGLAGIGATKKLNADALGDGHFKQIDITQTLELPIASKKARLLTTHPQGSYRFEGEVEKLVITDPQAFWSASKYLVVMAD